MQLKKGQKVRLQIIPCNQGGTPQGAPIVDMQIIPRFEPNASGYDVTRYKFVLTNPQGGTSTVENPVSIVP